LLVTGAELLVLHVVDPFPHDAATPGTDLPVTMTEFQA
jgi:hypothetical protein